MKTIPYEVSEQIIQCFGKCFHLKDTVAAFMISSDVPYSLVNKYRHEYKFVWARRVLEELSTTEEGRVIQNRILTNLYMLRDLPDKTVKDRNTGLKTLRQLKKIALENKLIEQQEKETHNSKEKIERERLLLIEQRKERLEQVRKSFNEALIMTDRQKAGFILEDILKELFEVFDIDYRKSFRNPTNTQQIDGHFKFEGFDYLVESKWTTSFPDSADISSFKNKIDSKLSSTRGIFISIIGFRDGVVQEFSGRDSKIIFVSGEDLIHVLEGRLDLHEALRMKIKKAAQEGVTYFSVSNL
ncbi:hypothetical protein [Salinicoccus bachuensis]|uniref:Restriction endonuclease n=1 Tax=Salinicoccus bachuensis TaxID=3136731 RepID=A0ABZ3CMC5_9STAP